jgi:MFS family permease
VTAYALAFGSLLLAGARIGDLFGRKRPFVPSTIGFGAAVGLLLGGLLTQSLSWRWTLFVNLDFAVVACLVAGAVLLALFVAIQIRAAHPLMPLRVVPDRDRGGSYLALAIVGLGTFGFFLFLTYYLQQTKGYSPIRTGVAFLPLAVASVISAAVANVRVVPGTGRGPVLALGMALSDG